jgi:hypothetical protein
MSDYARDDSFDCFDLVWDAEYSAWDLVHQSTGQHYFPGELLFLFTDCADYDFLRFRKNSADYAFNEMGGEFYRAWLVKMHAAYVLWFAETRRVEYLEQNPGKGKQAERAYAEAMAEAENFYRRMK